MKSLEIKLVNPQCSAWFFLGRAGSRGSWAGGWQAGRASGLGTASMWGHTPCVMGS